MLRLVILSGVIFSLLLGGLTRLLQQNYETEISPNWFLYTYIDEPTGQTSVSLYLANLDTGEKHLITDRLSHNGYGIISVATWSPDGHWLYFKATDQNRQHNLYRQHIHSSTPQIVISNWERSYDFRYYGGEFAWSPDGQWILHSRDYQGTYYDEEANTESPVSGYGLYRMKPDGSDVRRLSNEPQLYEDFAISVTFSPDKQWHYFMQNSVLYRTTLDGQNTQSIATQVGSGQFKGWSQDNKWLYFTTYYNQGAYPLYRVKADGSEVERLIPLPEDEQATRYKLVRWVEKDTSLIYRADNSYYLLNIQTGARKHLMDSDDNTISPQLSADSQWIFVAKFNQGLYRLPVGESAEPEWLAHGDEFRGFWNDDYSAFYYKMRDEDNGMQYSALDMTTFEATPIDPIDYLRVSSGNMFSPDNRYVLIQKWKDLCRQNLSNQTETCLNTIPQDDEFAEYEEKFLSWMPPFVDKSWHANSMYLLSGLFLLLVSGFSFYAHRKNVTLL